MKELIKIEEKEMGGERIQAVNARDLHEFLDSKQDFSTWIKKRIASYGFVEGIDYIKLSVSPTVKMAETGGELADIVTPQKNWALETTGCADFGQQGRIEYAITLAMAKELSMVERNQKGKEARQYFIGCEKQLKAQHRPKLQSEIILESARLLVKLEREQAALKAEQLALAERQRITEGKLEDFATGAEHFSITAYNKLFREGYAISNNEANKTGRALSKLAKNQGIALGSAPHPVWGTVNTYPKALLDSYYRGDFGEADTYEVRH